MDWTLTLLTPLHNAFGVSATITPTTSASAATLTMIDKTSGVALPARDGEIETVVPAAVVLTTALADAGLTRADLKGSTLQMNGKTYRVENTRPLPTPGGEADGEIMLLLVEA
ncbi:head-tail joining protein [Alsobacter sp. R-9]